MTISRLAPLGAGGSTSKLPLAVAANPSIPRTISTASRTGNLTICKASVDAAASITEMYAATALDKKLGLNSTAILVRCGATSLSSSGHLPAIDVSKVLNPVVLPSGWAMLSTKPLTTGSPPAVKTIGMVLVCRWTAIVAAVGVVTITSGRGVPAPPHMPECERDHQLRGERRSAGCGLLSNRASQAHPTVRTG